MKYETIADILTANEETRRHYVETLNGISEDEAAIVPQGEKWSIRQIAEHLAMVDQGIARICRKLLAEAKATGKMSDGQIAVSPEFLQRVSKIADEKVEAPERVQPTGNVSIGESVEQITTNKANFESMRDDLETYDLSDAKFPHPYFGSITAVEWLIVAGGHEFRHTKQIERLLKRIRQ